MLAGAVGDSTGRWGGQLLVTLHEQGRPARRFTSTVPSSRVRFSTTDADLRIGEARVDVRPDGRYAVSGSAREDGSGTALTLDLVVSPSPGAYFPGATLTSGIVSGYVVPALSAEATGSICVGERMCNRYDGAQAYHDHNWGVWRGVTWEWGAARAGEYTFLYGRVEPPDSVANTQPLFVYLVDASGFVALFRPREIRYVDGRTTLVNGRTIRTPSTAEMVDVRGDDTLRLALSIEDASASDTREGMAERGEGLAARRLLRPYFVQMKGTARLRAGYEEPRSRDPERGSSRPTADRSAVVAGQRQREPCRRLESVESGPGREAGFPSTRSLRSSTTFAALCPVRSAALPARSNVFSAALPARCKRAVGALTDGAGRACVRD